MLKKFMTALVFLASLSLLVACAPAEYTVSFDSLGGSAVDSVVVLEDETVSEPTDPTRESAEEGSAWNFTGWYTDADATEAYDFSSPVQGDLTLYAGWTQQIVVRFNTRTDATIESQFLPVGGGEVTEPAAPSREGYDFGGWFYTKRGLTWLEDEAVEFPLSVDSAVQLYAYWTPTDSSAVDYATGETYMNSFTELTADPILNPLTYHWSHENSLMGYLSTPLYGTDVDWDQAIADGLASAPGDFSNIDDSNIGALVRKNVLYGAASFPMAVGGDFDGETGVDQDGNYSEAISREIMSTTYRYTLRDDLYWEDGSPVTAQDYYYSYFQYIDGTQNNYRASSYYPNADRSSGLRVVNARAYFLQGTEIGLGESEANPLTGDYGYAELTGYVGPNVAAGYEGYIGYYLGDLFSNVPTTAYVDEATLTAAGLTAGDEGVALAGEAATAFGFSTDSHWLADLDLRVDVSINPFYAGDKGDLWPAVAKEDVGFKVIDDHTFEMTFEVPISHASAMSNGDFTLVNPEAYAASLDENGTNSNYGTYENPFVSYGAYLIKSWDPMQKIILNKNYNAMMQKYYNYKAISFEFYPNVDTKMQAFSQGLLSSASLNQTYYSQYLEDPNLKSYYNGYSEYLLFNTEAYDGQDASVVSAIQNLDFRQAFFFGFNRSEYAATVNAPNVPSLLIYGGLNATQYDNDPEWYVNTPEYAAMLEDLSIDYDTYGYDPVKAEALFDAAYDAWVAEGNEGPITLNYLTSEGAENERVDNYIIDHYTQLFGSDKISFEKNSYTTAVSSDKQDAHEFDIVLTSVGTGSVTNTSVMLPIIGLFFQETYGDQFGFNTMSDLGIPADVLNITEENKIDLRATYAFLQTVTDRFDETTDNGSLWPLWEILVANDGYFVGDLEILFQFGLDCTFIWAGLAPQYDGDVADRNAVTRAFDAIILEYVPVVPLLGTASAVVYASNVVNEWPAYHNIMEWGASRYWHLSTDADWQ